MLRLAKWQTVTDVLVEIGTSIFKVSSPTFDYRTRQSYVLRIYTKRYKFGVGNVKSNWCDLCIDFLVSLLNTKTNLNLRIQFVPRSKHNIDYEDQTVNVVIVVLRARNIWLEEGSNF